MIVALLAAASLCPPATAPALTVPSAPVLHGDPLSVRLTGLRPRSLVAVTASRPTGWGRPRVQTARATFRADACDTVDATDDAPLDGTWSGSDPRALFWSMKATDAAPAAGWTASEVRIAADTNADGAPDLAASVCFADDPRPEVPLGDALPGAFFMAPPGNGPHPAIVLLGGSEGGDDAVRARARQFTARGYAVVGLPYYAPSCGAPSRFPALPAAFWNIPVDRMEGVLGWLRARTDVDPSRIGMFGVSKGAELALAAASRMSGFAAVAAIVPTDVIWEARVRGPPRARARAFPGAAPRSRSCRTRAWTRRSPN